MRKFNFDEKENYTHQELLEILKQHSGFKESEFKNFVPQEEYNKVLEELKPLKSDKRKSHLNSLVKDLTDDDKLSDAINLSGISEEDDDEAIVKKVKATIEARPYLQKINNTPPELVKKSGEKKEEVYVKTSNL